MEIYQPLVPFCTIFACYLNLSLHFPGQAGGNPNVRQATLTFNCGKQMNTQPWFELRYRDKSFAKYLIAISDIQHMSGGAHVIVYIYHDETLISRFKIEFSGTWISLNSNQSGLNKSLLGNEYSPLIGNLIKDYIFGKRMEDLNGNTISIHTGSEYSKSIFQNTNGILNYQRDPAIVAKENKFARKIVLRELYIIHTGRGPSSVKYIIENCNFYDFTLRNAIEALKDKGFILSEKADTLRLSYSGLTLVEERLLTPFNDTIFLVAACNELIYKLIEKIYEPAVNELGYELIFQERSEPKGTIHDDIWEYLEHSKLILCDLSFQRPNCFIEYGYALAKGKRIILCVEESEGKTEEGLMAVPFDTITQKYSFWRKEWLSSKENTMELSEFKQEIKNRIDMKLRILEIESKI